jgi:hypothetical protein
LSGLKSLIFEAVGLKSSSQKSLDSAQLRLDVCWLVPSLAASSDGDFGKYFHLPVSVNFGKWILFTGKLPVIKKIN